MRANVDLKIKKYHNIFLACIFHNMEFVYGNCSIETMIKDIADDILCIYDNELPDKTKENIRNSSETLLELYKEVLKININTNSGYIMRTGLLNAFYFLFLCFVEISGLEVNGGSIHFLEKTRTIFFDSTQEKPDNWVAFEEKLEGTPQPCIKSLNNCVAKLIANAGKQLEQLFWAVCKFYADIYISENKTKDIDIRIKLDNNTELEYKYRDEFHSNYIDENFVKIWSCYCSYENEIEKIQKTAKAELKAVIEDIDKKYLNYKKDVLFVCITYMVLNWLGADAGIYKSLKPFENTTSIIDLQKLWFTLSDPNCFADTGKQYLKKNEAASKFIKNASSFVIPVTLVIPVTDVTKKAIETSINTYVANNPKSAVAEELSAGTHITIENIDNINKTITIVFDTAWGKALPDDAYDEMSKVYYSGCIDSVEEYVKKLHFTHGCNPSDITECLDQIIAEAESDDEECMACSLDDAEKFVENALNS